MTCLCLNMCVVFIIWQVESDFVLYGERPTQPSIPSGSVNEYQLRLRRQRHIWFILLADECGVCR